MMHQMKLSGGRLNPSARQPQREIFKDKDSGQSREFGFAGMSV
jgi:hypothetical protein